jgi:hypothetical protein
MKTRDKSIAMSLFLGFFIVFDKFNINLENWFLSGNKPSFHKQYTKDDVQQAQG